MSNSCYPPGSTKQDPLIVQKSLLGNLSSSELWSHIQNNLYSSMTTYPVTFSLKLNHETFSRHTIYYVCMYKKISQFTIAKGIWQNNICHSSNIMHKRNWFKIFLSNIYLKDVSTFWKNNFPKSDMNTLFSLFLENKTHCP